MAKRVDLSNWVPLGGKTRQYRNIKTGETISRRQYDKLRGINYERKAYFSKARDPKTFYLRPARGRKSARDLSGEFAQQVIEERKAAEAVKQKEKKAEVVKRKKKRKFERQVNKRVHQKVVRPQLLKPGSKGARISFDSYEGYLKALNEMRNMRVTVNGQRQPGVAGYAIGVIGTMQVNDVPTVIGAFLTRMRSPQSAPISEDDLIAMTEQFLESRPYFTFLHWFIHIAFNIHYAREKKAKKK